MDLSSGGVAALVFKPVIRGEFGQLSLDGQMLSVLMALDGRVTLGQVAQKVGISLADIRPVITKLINLKLVESIERAVSIVDQEFMDFLIARMSIAIGPLGEIIVEDGLEELGFNKNNFPSLRIAELVNFLSQEIQREDKRIEFQQAMLRKIREKGY
jgi:DNA-binding transcriptional regulator GbsR (MarR family)